MAKLGKAGIVYACGEWEHGQLGLPLDTPHGDASRRGRVPFSGERTVGHRILPSISIVDQDGNVSELNMVPRLESQKIVSIGAGGDHSFAISSTGRVFAFGKNDSYQLGITVGNHVFSSATARMGVNISRERTEDSLVAHEPLQVVHLRWKNVVEIACGDCHSLARCESGVLYAWGMGTGGRLGLGHHRTVQHPTKIAALTQHKCTSIAAGYHHSLALTEQGQIFAWGTGDGGQLGTGLSECSLTPTAIASPSDVGRWRCMAAGEYHSAAISEGGGCFTWGLNTFGQLGQGDLTRRPSPTRVKTLTGVRGDLLACGQAFCILVAASTEVWSWGRNDAGQLGLGDAVDRPAPQPLPALRGVALCRLACGGRHAAALDRQGRLWTWGHAATGCLALGPDAGGGGGGGGGRALPACVPRSEELGLERLACGYAHTIAVSALDLAEVQTRDFFLRGLVHPDEPLRPGFCLFGSGPSVHFQPLSHARAFYERHGVAAAADPVVVLDPPADPALRLRLARLAAAAAHGPTALERLRLLALGVYYELGGAQGDLEAVARRHLAAAVERAPYPSGLVPLGAVRLGGPGLRAGLLKLACDAAGLGCGLVRGGAPAAADGYLDPASAGGGEGADWYVWALVRVGEQEVVTVDLVTRPTDLRPVDDLDSLLRQLGLADHLAP